jgi:hypothetical protein
MPTQVLFSSFHSLDVKHKKGGGVAPSSPSCSNIYDRCDEMSQNCNEKVKSNNLFFGVLFGVFPNQQGLLTWQDRPLPTGVVW